MNNSQLNVTQISTQSFGQLSTGEQASLFIFTNHQGAQLKVTNFGGIIVSITMPDKTQRMADIVLGYDNVADYEADSYYLGAVIGRYAGRIDQGHFSLDGKDYQLNLNAPDSQLHGGKNALNKQLWQAEILQQEQGPVLSLSYTSPDGEEGFPGEVSIKVNYQFTEQNELIIEYFAYTNKTTIVNLTQHSYFNLAGHNSGDIHQHLVAINADYFLPMNERAYPTGEIKVVKNTAHDFCSLRCLADEIDSDDEQIKIGLGYDNYWLTNDSAITGQKWSAQVVEPDSGRRMTLYCDQPSMILYTANYIDGSHYGKGNYRYQKRAALCLEPQRANNKETGVDINNTKLTPELPFYSKSRYVFDVIS